MKDKKNSGKRNENKMPSDFYTALAENTRAINDFATTGFVGQQMLLTRLSSIKNAEEKEREIEDLTK
ncbi:MAG: hypothetical protein Q4D44_07875 [Eubacteriales bacterium]|nr:hypothetical protein [Eubacteriales bacterium]